MEWNFLQCQLHDYYKLYIRKLIIREHLENNVKFLGVLNVQQMKEQMLKSHVFIQPSSIENSPNSLGEAMLLGLPCIASDVGGTSTMIVNNKEGFLYPWDEPYMIVYYIRKIFENDSLASSFGSSARKHALITHDRNINNEKLLNIYYKEIN